MDWSFLFPMLLGAAVSLASSLAMFSVSTRWERQKREAEDKARAASAAYQGLAKLASIINTVHSVNITVAGMFEESEGDGGSEMQPGVKVLPIVGAPSNLPRIEAHEIVFLLTGDQADLYNKLIKFELTATGAIKALVAFNEKRIRYQELVEAQILSGHEAEFSDEGMRANLTMTGSVGAMFSARIGELNSLIGQLLEQLEAANTLGREVLIEYQEFAANVFGDSFPVRKIGFADGLL